MRTRLIALTAALAALAATGLVGIPARAAGPTLPSGDPFYTYKGNLKKVAPGTILRERSVSLGLGNATLPPGSTLPIGTVLPGTAEQLLYRTTNELGKPTVTVTTVLVPPGAMLKPKIVAYLSFYDALSDMCDPSYTLQGGDPDSANAELTDLEQGLVELYQADLDAVVTVPDFEGEHLDWTAGHEAGYGTLDAITATEAYLGETPQTTPVGLTGYSGGSIAADWASELAASHAPDLDIAGVAEGGIPVDFAHNVTYIDGSAQWSGIMPAVLDALARSFNISLQKYLSPLGRQLASTDSSECIGDFLGSDPGLTVAQLVKPKYANILQVPAFVRVVNAELMGTAPGAPKGPLFMAVGNDPSNAQGQGDDIMVTGDVEALAHEYCGQGVSVDYEQYAGLDHDEAALAFEPNAIAFLGEVFGGVTPKDDCSTVGAGNDIDPLPSP